DEYLRMVGKTTRKHLPYYLRRVDREWSGRWNFGMHHGIQIQRSYYDRIIDLNGLRMARQGRRSGWNSRIAEQRWKLFQERGIVCTVLLDGRVVAGTMCVT